MKNSTILLNSCETDLIELRKDVDSGLYEQNTEGFLKEVERVSRKINDVKEEKMFEDEQDQVEAEERMAEEVVPEEEEPGKHVA